MTLLVATLTPAFAMMSMDTFVARPGTVSCRPGAHCTDDATDAIASARRPDAEFSRALPLAFGGKIAIFPHLRMIMGAAGMLQQVLKWRCVLDLVGQLADIEAVNEVAPELLQKIAFKMALKGGLTVFHLGWSDVAGGPVGYAYADGNGFEPVRLQQGFHSMTPMPDVSGADPFDLCAMWTGAASGEDPALTERFHVAVARHQYDANRRGELGDGLSIGGQLHTARLDQAGVSVRVTHTFADYEEEAGCLRKAGTTLVKLALGLT